MTEDYTDAYEEAITQIVDQLEKLILNRVLSSLKDLNYEYEPLRSAPTKTRDDEPPF